MTPVVPGTVPVQNEDRMLRLIRAGFGQRRKTLLNALMRAPASFNLGFGMDDREKIERLLAQAGIDGQRRGETLSLDEYARLADTPAD
jgi:16S rRNA (adenine1518-N6/adenine1519-N6)-dimethyltransferase